MKRSLMILVIVFAGIIGTSFAPVVPSLYWDNDGDGYHSKISNANGWSGYYAQIRRGWKTSTLGFERFDNDPTKH